MTHSPGPVSDRPGPAPRLRGDLLSDVVSTAVSAGLLLVLLAVFAATTPAFRLGSALAFMISAGWVYALPAVGLTLVMAAGRMDLSGAAVAMLAAALAGRLDVAGVPLLIGFVAAAVVSALVGALSGLLASISRPASFVVTLATAGLCLAIAELVLGSQEVVLPVGDGGLTPLLVPGILLALLGCTLGVIALVSPAGAWLRHLGAAREGTVAVRPLVVTLVAAYAVSAVLAAGAGVLELARTGAAVAPAPTQLQLGVVLVALLGGASLRGGRGMGFGAIAAGLAVAALVYGLAALSLNGAGTLIVLAAALAGAAALDELRSHVLR
jgi:ribose/xylose/arabinose/galactoside ABC-type transport system permease subunit